MTWVVVELADLDRGYTQVFWAQETDTARIELQQRSIKVAGVAIYAIAIVMSGFHIWNQAWLQLGLSLFAIFALTISFVFAKKTNNYNLVIWSLLGCLVVSLAVKGTKQQADIYFWLYVIPGSIFYLTNARAGLLANGIVFLALCCFLQLYPPAIVAPWAGSVILTSLSFVMLQSYLYERVRKQNEQRLQELSMRDELTGLWNRRKFNEQADLEVERCLRYKRSFALVLIDIDGFKEINDQLGHDVGDVVLQSVAKVLQENIRETDFLARLGGDEFALMLLECVEPNPTEKHPLEALLEELRLAVKERVQGYRGGVSLSLGGAMLREQESLARLYKRADNALYRVKRKGKGDTRLDKTAEFKSAPYQSLPQ